MNINAAVWFVQHYLLLIIFLNLSLIYELSDPTIPLFHPTRRYPQKQVMNPRYCPQESKKKSPCYILPQTSITSQCKETNTKRY